MDKFVIGMGALRIISGTIELTAAILILYLGTIERAMIINAGLAVIGPTVLVLVTTIGLFGLAGKISILKFSLVLSGALLILIGLLKQ